jgi:hypothetical protein
MVDRFSMPPPQGQNLLRIARLKLAARTLGIRRLDLGPQGGYVVFEEKNSIDPAAVIRLLQKAPREYRLDGPLKLRISRPMEKEEMRFDFATDLLKRLEAATPTSATAPKDAPSGKTGGAGGSQQAVAAAKPAMAASGSHATSKVGSAPGGSHTASKPSSSGPATAKPFTGAKRR